MTTLDKLTAALAGGISVTHLRVYNTLGPDGLREVVHTYILHALKLS